MSTTSIFPIHLRPIECIPEDPFKGDLMGRKAIAERLTQYIDRLPDGCVIAINAPWGEGKTWFGLNWTAHLRELGHKTVYIDAFKRDYIEDPFLMICGELIAELGDKSEGIKASGAKVAKALAPTAAKIAINAIGRIVLGTTDLSDAYEKSVEELQGDIAKAAEKQLTRRLDEYDQDKKSVDGFYDYLSEAADAEEKPIVIIVDELDRCRPDFAVKTLERIKHFFDVPKIVFVLLINKEHLESAINGVYGQKVNASDYLGKFIQISLQLPKLVTTDTRDFNYIYGTALSKRLGLPHNDATTGFVEVFGKLAGIYDLSLRDLERGFSLFSLAHPINNVAPLLAWIILIKLKRPDIFRGLLGNRQLAHQEALEFSKQPAFQNDIPWISTVVQDLHDKHSKQFETPVSDETRHFLQSLGTWSLNPDRFIPWLCARIDFAIDR